MKRKNIIIVACIALTTFVTQAGSLTHVIGVSETDFNYTIEGDSCVVISMNDACLQGDPYTPELPVYYYTLIVPSQCRITGVSGGAVSIQNYVLPYPVRLAQPLITTNGDTLNSEPHKVEANVYDMFEIVSDGYFDGDIHLVTIAYHPIIYEADSLMLQLAISSSFTLHYTEGVTPDGIALLHPVGRSNEARIAMMQHMVVNPSQLPSHLPVSPAREYNTSSLPGNNLGLGYEYLIVTTRELLPATQKLVDWKRSKGLYAGAVCIEDILAANIDDVQDVFTEISDAPGKLRVYFRNAFEAGLQYAFLVSERGEIPYRRYYNKDTPTDFYYCELNGEWRETVEDGLYSYSEKAAEIAIGRLFVSDEVELEKYIDRLITYERNPGNGNPEYLRRNFVIQSDLIQKENLGREVATGVTSLYPDTVIWEEQPSCYAPPGATRFPEGKDVINELQNNPSGYFSTYAHGGQMWTTAFSGGDMGSGGYHIWVLRSVENDTITNWWSILTDGGDKYLETGAGVDLLHIPDNPFIVYSISCTTMPYDTVDINLHPVTLGVAFTAKSESAIAYLGNTRVGYIYTSPILHQYFNEQLLQGNTHLGVAENCSKNIYSNGNSYYLSATHNLLGCPEIPMWTAVPQKVTNLNSNDTITITPLFSSEAPVEGIASSLNDYSVNSTKALIRRNYYPYFFKTKLEDKTVDDKYTVFGSDFEIGDAFVIEEDGGVEIEATGTVVLKSGFTVKNGGSFSVKNVKQ